MEEVENFSKEKIELFDEWVTKFVVLRKIRRNWWRRWSLKKWFLITQELSLLLQNDQKSLCSWKLKAAKLNEALTALQANYDFQSLIAYNDATAIQQLNNDLITLHMDILVMEVEFAAK